MTINTKPRILIFSTAYYPFVGGAEVAVREITERLSDDFDFDLITARLEKKLLKVEVIGKVNVYRVGIGVPFFDKISLPFLGAIKAWNLEKKANYKHIWGVMVTFGSGAGYILNILRTVSVRKRIPITLTLQEGDSESHLEYKWAGLINLSWRLALWQTDFLTAISNFLLNRAIRKGYKGQSALVPNGVDINIFSQKIDEGISQELISRLNKKSEDIFLVTTGRLTHKNGIEDIISSLTLLPPNVSLVVIGKGELGNRLQKLATDLKVDDRVKFLGFIPYSEMPKYFSICDIFVRPSRSEGFGNSFIEAMAAGIPVIATPVGGIPDFISDRETGLFCSTDNPKSIAVAVKTLITDIELKNSIIKNANELVKERYGWDNIALQMKKVFDRVRS
jgi:glycosyltransferase involved in cell wall biosynthesis